MGEVLLVKVKVDSMSVYVCTAAHTTRSNYDENERGGERGVNR